MKKLITVVCIVLFSVCGTFARPTEFAEGGLPMIGGQIFIEPGQNPEHVDRWFRSMHENGMTVCRIRMFEEYMRTPDGNWDFSLFDRAFDAAAKNDVKVFATLFPSGTNGNSLGGFKHPQSEEHLRRISVYIERVVRHYMDHPAFYGWVLINEPGSGGWLPNGKFTDGKFRAWKAAQPACDYDSQGYSTRNFDRERFLVDYNTWYLNWIAEEIAKYDTTNYIHVNNHQIFENVAEYDFPAWRKFLTSLGASAHPSWHFGYFRRDQYAAALGANCQIIRSGAGELPFWVTELQGGNNTYSGIKAFCPTAEEVTQWLWTSIAGGAKGVIFWCYNPRSSGEEAGEWAMLNFQNENSDRLDAAAKVAACLAGNDDLFASVVPVESHISVVYLRETLWVEKRMQMNGPKDPDYEGRSTGGAMKSALGIYETLLSLGVNANFREMNEYDWTKDDYSGETVILSNQVSLPSYYWSKLRRFVKNGGKLIVEGLTGFFDENIFSLHNTGFPLADVFGGEISEVKTIPGDFSMSPDSDMPVHLWKSYIANHTGTVLFGNSSQTITAIRNKYGEGETLWIPSLVSLGARRTGNAAPLASLLVRECASSLDNIPFRFADFEDRVMMSTLASGGKYVTVLINKGKEPKQVDLLTQRKNPRVIFADKTGSVKNRRVSINPEETMVLLWE